MKKPELPPETEHYYYSLEPVYDHYKTVKVIDRCDCCGHKTGEHTYEKGVKIIGWEVVKNKKDIQYHMMKAMYPIVEKQIFEESVLLTHLKGKK